MNILIKLMSIVSLVIAPTLAGFHKNKVKASKHPVQIEKTITYSTSKHHANTVAYGVYHVANTTTVAYVPLKK